MSGLPLDLRTKTKAKAGRVASRPVSQMLLHLPHLHCVILIESVHYLFVQTSVHIST